VNVAVPTRVLLDDSTRLHQAEQQIEQARSDIARSFLVIGRELRAIRDSGIYKTGYPTFDSYVVGRWGISRSRAYKLIDGAAVADLVSPVGDIPNERQARELVPLARENEQAAVEVWRDVCAENGNGVTAAKVREAVNGRAAPKPPTLDDVLKAACELQRVVAAYLAEAQT
jgi:hypothetical protein